ncbi:MAG: hypothetical protein ACI867_001205 [Glaciecola sp.]|jgi:uncharacterized protein (DUF952 family)
MAARLCPCGAKTAPMNEPVSLLHVTPDLVAATQHAVHDVSRQARVQGVCCEVVALGSSAFVGALSKGDIDVLLRVACDNFAAAVAELDSIWDRAQPENWTDDFASFVTPHRVGVQVTPLGGVLDHELTRQMALLADADVRIRYDEAKRHGAPLGTRGYWQVKDVFWSCLGLKGPIWPEAVVGPILKVLTGEQWARMRSDDLPGGAPVDEADGFIHFSTPEQVEQTITRHFAGVDELWVLTVDAGSLGAQLRWEPSRGGALFPHLYGPLLLGDVALVRPVAGP